MQVKDCVIPYHHQGKPVKLYGIGDIHCGTIHCTEDRIKAKVGEIAEDELAWWVGLGDYSECITPDDRRWDPSQKAVANWLEQDDIAECQRRWVVKLFEPIKKQCLGLLYGNHEESIRRRHFTNIHKHICEDLGVDNLGYSCFLRLFFRRAGSNESHIIKCALTHGSGCAITKGAKVNRLKRFMDDFDAHLYAYAHMHDYISDTKPYMTLADRPFGQSKIKECEAVGAVTGSWFRTYTNGIVASYGEQKVYPPTVLGCALFTINVSTWEVDVQRSK